MVKRNLNRISLPSRGKRDANSEELEQNAPPAFMGLAAGKSNVVKSHKPKAHKRHLNRIDLKHRGGGQGH